MDEKKKIKKSASFLWAAFLLIAVGGVIYIRQYIDSATTFIHFNFHILIITLVILVALLIASLLYVRYSDRHNLIYYFSSLGFLAFALIFSFHGFFTGDNPALFIIFSPVSRVVMFAYLVIGLYRFEKQGTIFSAKVLPHILLFAGLGFAAYFSVTSLGLKLEHIRFIEAAALGVAVWGIIKIISLIPRRSSVIWIFLLAMIIFGQASVVFLLSHIWDIMWWFGHIVFALGFFILTYALFRQEISEINTSPTTSQPL